MNLFDEFQKLIPKSAVIVCSVQQENADGTSRVLTLDNQPLVVRGTNHRAQWAQVFVKDGLIIGDAPAVPVASYSI
jgi:hypothetical protein